MARENVMKFEELLQGDKTLQAKLNEATAAYTGDKADVRAVFDAVVAPLATEAGMPFTYDKAIAVGDEAKELDDSELEAFAGGKIEFSGGIGSGACKEAGGGVGGSYSPDTEFQTTSGSKMNSVCIGIGAGAENRKTTKFSFCVIGGISVDW